MSGRTLVRVDRATLRELAASNVRFLRRDPAGRRA
jgi:hypothetical protein